MAASTATPALGKIVEQTERFGLFLEFVGAKSVAPKDNTGLSDPYLVVSDASSRELWRSAVCDQTLFPRWQQFLPLVNWVRLDDEFTITAFDKDKVGTDDYLGTVTLKAADFTVKDTSFIEDFKVPFQKDASHTQDYVSGELILNGAYRKVGSLGEQLQARVTRRHAACEAERTFIDEQETRVKLLPPKAPAIKAENLHLEHARERLHHLEELERNEQARYLACDDQSNWEALFESASAAHRKLEEDAKYLHTYQAAGMDASKLQSGAMANRAAFDSALKLLVDFEEKHGLGSDKPMAHGTHRKLFSKNSVKGLFH